MGSILQPGIAARDFVLLAGNLESEVVLRDHLGRNLVLVFFPSNPDERIIEQLAKYQTKMADPGNLDAVLIGISDASKSDLKRLSENKGIRFPLLSDTNPVGATRDRYGVSSPTGSTLPSVFVIDDRGLIRRMYESSRYPYLPNPAMVVRAVKKLGDVPRPIAITLDDWQLGPPNAPVTLIEYADYQCRPCREANKLLKQIVPIYGDKVLWVHRHLPLRHSHPLAQQAAEAAEAAGAQGKFWEMHDQLFEAEGALERERLIEYAREIGLEVTSFIADLDSRRMRDAVNQDFKMAVSNKIKLPPALFINYIAFEGPRTSDAICARIDSLLACGI